MSRGEGPPPAASESPDRGRRSGALVPGGIKHASSRASFTDFSLYGLTVLSPQSRHLARKMLRRRVVYGAAPSEADQGIRKGDSIGRVLPRGKGGCPELGSSPPPPALCTDPERRTRGHRSRCSHSPSQHQQKHKCFSAAFSLGSSIARDCGLKSGVTETGNTRPHASVLPGV